MLVLFLPPETLEKFHFKAKEPAGAVRQSVVVLRIAKGHREEPACWGSTARSSPLQGCSRTAASPSAPLSLCILSWPSESNHCPVVTDQGEKFAKGREDLPGSVRWEEAGWIQTRGWSY